MTLTECLHGAAWLCLTAGLLAPPAHGQGAGAGSGPDLLVAAEAAPGAPTLQHIEPEQMMAGMLGSQVVRDASGQEIGDVEGAVLTYDGRIAALLVGVGGVLGLGEKIVAVRFDHVTIVEDEEGTRSIDLALTRAELEAAPTFAAP